MSSKAGAKPRNIRQPVTRHEGNAHLYAAFGVHWRAGIASLIPFAIIYFSTQPLADAMATLALGAFTLGPAVVAAVATGWALMSMVLLHYLRFEERTWVQYGVYAGVGAAVLTLLAVITLILVQLREEGTADFWNATAFARLMIGAPLIGAVGSIVGRRTLAAGVFWHIWIERKPLPDVFTYVEGKRDKDEFERM